MKQFRVNGVKVVVVRDVGKDHWKLFKELGVDLIVEKKGDKTVVVRNDFAKRKVDLSKLIGRYPVSYLAETGFKAVIDFPLEELVLEELVKVVSSNGHGVYSGV